MARPNLRKSEPSNATGFSAAKKPSESTPNQGLNFTAEQELGSIGGVKATGKLTVGVDNLIGQQGVQVEIDATNRTAGFNAGIGSTRGKLGVNIGGKVGYDPNGNISIKGVEAAVNIGGFGGGISLDDERGASGSISVAGAKVEVRVEPGGKISTSLCYGVPAGELCVTFEPNEEKKVPVPPTPTPTPPGTTIPPGALLPGQIDPAMLTRSCENPYVILHFYYTEDGSWDENGDFVPPTTFRREGFTYRTGANGEIGWISEYNNTTDGNYSLQDVFENTGDATPVYFTIPDEVRASCFPPPPPANPPPPQFQPLILPNYPQHYKPMDCCEKVEEIYKYLGIAKMKKKFKVARQFLVPNGKGNEECEDYYALNEALFRMLANGLILNPISTPLGSEWKSVNATAWAGQVYEMVAEAMSNGDTSQKFEISAIMQLVQLMSAIAELSRKVDFVSEVLGVTPDLNTEDLSVCFTIHESHKGFEKKKPKEIDVSAAKTDDEVEKVLGKMLKPSKIPIVKWEFKPDSVSIAAALNRL